VSRLATSGCSGTQELSPHEDDVVTVIDAEPIKSPSRSGCTCTLTPFTNTPVAIAPVFDPVARVAHHNGGAVARNAAVDERDIVVGFAAANEKRECVTVTV